jgi:hypothetical protein
VICGRPSGREEVLGAGRGGLGLGGPGHTPGLLRERDKGPITHLSVLVSPEGEGDHC